VVGSPKGPEDLGQSQIDAPVGVTGHDEVVRVGAEKDGWDD
jgi:hypothetical protein